MSREDLPSVDDFAEDNSNLPSVDDFIVEEVEEELPSVEDFIEKEEIEEGTQTIEDLNGETFAEVEDIVPPWPELVRLINDVRADIPDIPEIKYYDKELEQLAEQISQVRDEIPEVPEVRYYEREVEAICEQIDLVRSEIKDLPEVKYYDEQVDQIEDRIDTLQTEVANLPEVKYYDAEIKAICEAIDAVKESIPKFPKWVNEVNEVPDFSWIGKTFSVIDDDFIKVNDHIDTLRERVDYNLKELSEDIDKKKFEAKVELDTKSEEIEAKIKEEKDKIWKEMRESSLRIWEYHKEFKDDDRKLKKQILGEYNSLKKSIDKKVNEFNENSVKTDKLLLDYFEDLRNEISSLPEVKYYDDDIRHVKTDIKELFKLVMTIKTEQKEIKDLQEGLLNEPPSEKEDVGSGADPLTPMDQKFATLDDLSSHYRLFINRIQQQIATIGGGGAGFIKDLDDVSFDQTTGTDQLLIYNGSQWVGIASTALSGGDASSASTLVLDVRNQNVGYALTIGTPVYQTGFNSGQDRLNVEQSLASDSSTMPAKGLVSSTLENNTNGQIIVYGELEGVDTSAFDVADELYVAPNGGLTNVRPTDPTHLVQKIAVVLKKSAGNGAILVYGAGRTNDVPNNVSIAGSITAADGFFSGNVTIGGTITYEDVKNVDSLGIVTARAGVDVLAGGINVTGVSTFNSDVNFAGDISGNVTIVSTDSGSSAAPELTLYRNSASPAPGDYLGQLMFKGENSNGGQENYAKITGKIRDETLGTEDGQIETAIKGNGSFTIVSRQRHDELQLINGVGLSVDGDTTLGTTSATSLTASAAFYMPQYTTTARDAATFNEGAMIYNTTTKKIEFYNGTSWQSLPGMSLGLTVALDG